MSSFREYQKEASKTFKDTRELSRKDTQITNWALGVTGEAGELAGEIKHAIFHQEGYDKMKIAKEIGDVLWYLSALCTSLGIDLGDCVSLNISKLRFRHGGEEFSLKGSAERHTRERKFEDTKEYQILKERILHGGLD